MCFAQIWRIRFLKGSTEDTYLHQLFNLQIPGKMLIGVVTASPSKLPSPWPPPPPPRPNRHDVLLAGAAVTESFVGSNADALEEGK